MWQPYSGAENGLDCFSHNHLIQNSRFKKGYTGIFEGGVVRLRTDRETIRIPVLATARSMLVGYTANSISMLQHIKGDRNRTAEHTQLLYFIENPSTMMALSVSMAVRQP